MKADTATETAVTECLKEFAAAYERRDMDGVVSAFAIDPDVIMYGTGADERRTGRTEIRKQAERDWAQTERAALKLGRTVVSAAGPVAWAASDATFDITAQGEKMSLPARLSTVLEKRDNRWQIVHLHCSFPSGEQPEGQSFPS